MRTIPPGTFIPQPRKWADYKRAHLRHAGGEEGKYEKEGKTSFPRKLQDPWKGSNNGHRIRPNVAFTYNTPTALTQKREGKGEVITSEKTTLKAHNCIPRTA